MRRLLAIAIVISACGGETRATRTPSAVVTAAPAPEPALEPVAEPSSEQVTDAAVIAPPAPEPLPPITPAEGALAAYRAHVVSQIVEDDDGYFASFTDPISCIGGRRRVAVARLRRQTTTRPSRLYEAEVVAADDASAEIHAWLIDETDYLRPRLLPRVVRMRRDGDRWLVAAELAPGASCGERIEPSSIQRSDQLEGCRTGPLAQVRPQTARDREGEAMGDPDFEVEEIATQVGVCLGLRDDHITPDTLELHASLPACIASWCTIYPATPTGPFWSVWGEGSTLHAVGPGGISRFDGEHWQPASDDGTMRAIAGLPDGTIVAVGDIGRVARRDATGSWSPRASPTLRRLLAVSGIGGDRFVAVGDRGAALRCDATSCVALPRVTETPLLAVAVARGEAWAFGLSGTVVRYRGEALDRVIVARTGRVEHFTAAVSDGTQVIAVGRGESWDSSTVVRLVDGALVRDPSSPPEMLLGAALRPDGSVVAVGYRGSIYTIARDGTWARLDPQLHAALHGAWADAQRIVAVGQTGAVRIDRTTVSVDGATHMAGLARVWIASDGTFFGVNGFDPSYALIGRRDRWAWSPELDVVAALDDVIGTSPANVVAVSQFSVARYDGTEWTTHRTDVDTSRLFALGDRIFAVGGTWRERAILELDGHDWRRVGALPVGVLDLVLLAPDHYWLVRQMGEGRTTSRQLVEVRDGAETVVRDGLAGGEIRLWAAGTDVVVVTETETVHWDGTSITTGPGRAVRELVGASPTSLWAVPSHTHAGDILRYDGRAWTTEPFHAETLAAAPDGRVYAAAGGRIWERREPARPE